MKIFVPFPLDGNQAIRRRLSDALGSFQNSSGGVQSFIDMFNHDVEALNNILNKPPSLFQYQQEAHDREQEYNWAIQDSKERWHGDNINIGTGKSVIANLTTAKKRYLRAKAIMELKEQRSSNILEMAELEGNASNFWHALEKQAILLDKADKKRDYCDNLFLAAQSIDELDNGDRFDKLNSLVGDRAQVTADEIGQIIAALDSTDEQSNCTALIKELEGTIGNRQKRLKFLKKDWQAQNIFVLADSKDLLQIRKDLNNIKQFLLFIDKSLTLNPEDPVDQKILRVLGHNLEKLKTLNKALIQALAWRIHAGGIKEDLRFDDPYYAIIQEIRQLVFLYDGKTELDPVLPHLTGLKEELFSNAMDLSTFEQCSKFLKESKDASALRKWMGTKWVKDKDKQNIISVEAREQNLIPAALSEYIPKKPGWTIGSLVRYYFFQTTNIGKNFLDWLRRKYLGPHSEFITLFNETHYQIKIFCKKIQDPSNERFRLNLYSLSQSSAFKNAIEIRQFIDRAKSKGIALKPSWTFSVLIKWLPLINRHFTYLFYSTWEKLLNTSIGEYRKNCEFIAAKLIDNYKVSLFESIQKKVFLLPNNLLKDIELFIQEYGSKELLSKFRIINKPINILKEFKFLNPQEDDAAVRTLNEDNVHAFLTFAEKYWTEEEYLAAKEISKLILREWVPSSNADLTDLFEKTKVLYKSNEKRKEFMHFLKYLAREYTFLTGDKGDEESLKFLERFWPDAAKSWENERSENLDDKFIFLLSIFDADPHFEVDLTQTKLFDAGQIKLDYRLVDKYIQDVDVKDEHYISDLLDKANGYVDKYDGSNNVYRSAVLNLGVHQPRLVMRYFEKRIGWLFANSTYQMTGGDKEFYLHACNNPQVRDALFDIIDERFTGQSDHLDELIDYINNPQMRGLYFAKRLQYMMANHSYQEILQTKIFESLSQNTTFIQEMNQYFNSIIQESLEAENIKMLESEGFCHMIERFGSSVNIEAYRILRIKRLLELNDFEHIQAYVQTLLLYVKDLDGELLHSEKAKALLRSTFEDYVVECEQAGEWHAHVQYLLKFFSMDLCPDLLNKVRLLWLKNYLLTPEKFSDTASIHRPTLDIRFHQENLQIPNEELDLTRFYGDEIQNVAKVIDQRLSQYSAGINENMLLLINRYLKDAGIKVQDQSNIYRKKMEDFQRAKDIIQALKHSKYELLFDLLDHFLIDYQGQKQLLSHKKTRYRKEIVDQQERILSSIYHEILEHVKLSLLSSGQIFNDQLDVKQDEIGKIVNLIIRSKLPESFKQQLIYLSKNNEEAHQLLESIQDNLVLERLHLFKIKTAEVELLRKFLSKPVKLALVRRMNIVQGFLMEDDPLHIALSAFKDILMLEENAENNERLTEARQIISAFKGEQKKTNRHIRDLASDIIQKLNHNQPISDLALFSNSKSSLQITFIQSLELKRQLEIADALINKLKSLSKQEVLEDEQADRHEWQCLASLYSWLFSIEKVKQKLEAKITPIAKEKFPRAQNYIQDLEHAMDDILKGRQLSSKFKSWIAVKSNTLHMLPNGIQFTSDVLQHENHLIHLSMFIRLFGGEQEKQALDGLIQEVLVRLRRAMMQGQFDPFRQHCIKFADKLVTMAGNDVQQEQCAKLMSLWNKFTSHDEYSVGQLKTQALEESLPDFLTRFDTKLFSYFTDRYNLKEDFVHEMRSRIRGMSYKKDTLNFDEILAKIPFKNFKKMMVPKDNKFRLFTSIRKVDERAAKKLYVAFCLALQAHQVAWILSQRIEKNNLSSFNVGIFVDVLTGCKETLEEKLKFNSHSLDRHFSALLNIQKDYFVSWDKEAEQPTNTESIKHEASEEEDEVERIMSKSLVH